MSLLGLAVLMGLVVGAITHRFNDRLNALGVTSIELGSVDYVNKTLSIDRITLNSHRNGFLTTAQLESIDVQLRFVLPSVDLSSFDLSAFDLSEFNFAELDLSSLSFFSPNSINDYLNRLLAITISAAKIEVRYISAQQSNQLNYNFEAYLNTYQRYTLPPISIENLDTEVLLGTPSSLAFKSSGSVSLDSDSILIDQTINTADFPALDFTLSLTGLSTGSQASMTVLSKAGDMSVSLQTRWPEVQKHNSTLILKTSLVGQLTAADPTSVLLNAAATLPPWLNSSYSLGVTGTGDIWIPMQFRGTRRFLGEKIYADGQVQFELKTGSEQKNMRALTQFSAKALKQTPANPARKKNHQLSSSRTMINANGKLRLNYKANTWEARLTSNESVELQTTVSSANFIHTDFFQRLLSTNSSHTITSSSQPREPVVLNAAIELKDGLLFEYNSSSNLSVSNLSDLIMDLDVSGIAQKRISSQLRLNTIDGILSPELRVNLKAHLNEMADFSFDNLAVTTSILEKEDTYETTTTIESTTPTSQLSLTSGAYYFKAEDLLKGSYTSQVNTNSNTAKNLIKQIFGRVNISSANGLTLLSKGDYDFTNLQSDSTLGFKINGALEFNVDHYQENSIVVQGLRGKSTFAITPNKHQVDYFKITAKEINIGVNLLDLHATGNFEYSPTSDRLDYSLSSFQTNLFNGQVFLLEENTAWLNLADLTPNGASRQIVKQDNPFELKFEALDLHELTQSFAKDQLAVTGTLNGFVPLTITPALQLSVEDADFTSIGGGVLQYVNSTSSAPQEHSNLSEKLLANALEHFEFSELSGMLDIDPNGQMPIFLQLTGSNSIQNHEAPVNLDIDLDINLVEILHSRRITSRIVHK